MEVNEEDFKTLVVLLNKLVTNMEPKENKPTEELVVKTKRKYIKKTLDKESDNKTKFKNKFCDMSESTMHKSDIAIDKKLNRFPPSKRGRKYVPISVLCRVCGRREDVNPSLVDSIERYKCNKCSRVAG